MFLFPNLYENDMKGQERGYLSYARAQQAAAAAGRLALFYPPLISPSGGPARQWTCRVINLMS
jgi:hypothetical protein